MLHSTQLNLNRTYVPVTDFGTVLSATPVDTYLPQLPKVYRVRENQSLLNETPVPLTKPLSPRDDPNSNVTLGINLRIHNI